MSNYIGSILSSYTASSVMSNISSPNWLQNSSLSKASFSDSSARKFATIASDYKALQTKKYDSLSSSYSYLQTVTKSETTTDTQSSTDKSKVDTSKDKTTATTKTDTASKSNNKSINLSADQMGTVYGKYATNSAILNMLV